MIALSLRGALTWLIVMVFVGLVNAEEPLRKIAVTASISNEVPVTNVYYRLTVEQVKPSLAEAKKEVDASIARLRERLGVLPAKQLNIQSPALEQGRRYKYERNDEKKFIGFYVERSLSIELTDYALVDRLETILAESDEFSLSGRSFSHKDQVQLRHDARKQALEAAQRKARSMAAVLEMNIGAPLEISEGSWLAPSSNVVGLNIPFTQGGFREETVTKAKGNKITISAEVNVVFEMKPPAK